MIPQILVWLFWGWLAVAGVDFFLISTGFAAMWAEAEADEEPPSWALALLVLAVLAALWPLWFAVELHSRFGRRA